MRYDHPNYIVRREACRETVAGANAVGARFAVFQKSRLMAVHSVVVTAGTSAGAGNAFIVKRGTTALSTHTLGTTTAGAIQSINVGVDIEPGEVLTVTNGTDGTGKGLVIYEYQVRPESVLTPGAV